MVHCQLIKMIKNDIYNNFCANSSADIYTRFIVDANRVVGNFLIQKCWTKVVFFKIKTQKPVSPKSWDYHVQHHLQ